MSSSENRDKVVAGHQPNFFPWFGYFEKMLNADVFVFSDDVRFPKRNYVNRVEIPTNEGTHQWCLPVQKGNDEQIAIKKYVKEPNTLDKLIKTARYNLSHLPCSSEVEPFLERFEAEFYERETVADLNIAMIKAIALAIGITTEDRRGSELGLEDYRATDRLIRRLEVLGADTYLSGKGADSYTEVDTFARAGRKLIYVDYVIGPELFGDSVRFSILAGIAKIGVLKIKERVELEIEKKAAHRQCP